MTQTRVMLLVDADNVSPNVAEQAVAAVMAAHGAAHIRRAYCTPESAVKNAALFQRLSLRPMVNLSAGKNATDIAMAVDAMDLAIAERPDVAVIVSSDSDFAPLVLRLREKGCRVEGIGQLGKTAAASTAVYDAFTDLVHDKPARAAAAKGSARADPVRAAAAKPAAPKPAAPKPAAPKPAAPKPAAPKASPSKAVVPDSGAASPKPASPAKKASARAPAKASPKAPAAASGTAVVAVAPGQLPEEVQQILAALPALANGQVMPLGIAAERLRAAGLLGKNAASTRLFGRMARHFALAPRGQPNTVQFVGAVSVG